MDPKACLERVAAALRDGDKAEAREARADLKEWLRRGGFAPDWSSEPAAAAFCGVSDEVIAAYRAARVAS